MEGIEVKKQMAILLIFLLAISTQAFASSNNYMLTKGEKGEVAEKTIVTDVNEDSMEMDLQQTNDPGEELEPNKMEELSINLDEDNSSAAETLCFVCSKYVYNDNPKFYVCVDGYWSKNCMIK